MEATVSPKPKHFVLQQLAEGVYAAIAEEGGAAICNAGLIDLGGNNLARGLRLAALMA